MKDSWAFLCFYHNIMHEFLLEFFYYFFSNFCGIIFIKICYPNPCLSFSKMCLSMDYQWILFHIFLIFGTSWYWVWFTMCSRWDSRNILSMSHLVPVCYIPRVETKERECWKFLDWRLNRFLSFTNISTDISSSFSWIILRDNNK